MPIPASVSAYLDRNGVHYSLLSHPIAYTAQEEAAAAHVPGREWAKAVVCIADDRPILAVVPASARIDFGRLRRATNAHALRLANEEEFKGLYTDCEVGAMPPFGPLYHQPVFVDESLTADREIAFNGGSHRDAIRMPFHEFARLVHPTIASFGIEPAERTTSRPGAMTIDPVCGRQIVERNAWGRSQIGEETYYFCSQACKMEFDDNPRAYSQPQ